MTLEGRKAEAQYSHSSTVLRRLGVKPLLLQCGFHSQQVEGDVSALMLVNTCPFGLQFLGTEFVGVRRFEALKSSLVL